MRKQALDHERCVLTFWNAVTKCLPDRVTCKQSTLLSTVLEAEKFKNRADLMSDEGLFFIDLI